MIIEKQVGEFMKYITNGEQETYDLGVRFGRILKPGMVISLNGDLGAGKTHFTKGIAAGLGIKDYVTSPSFTIVNEYEGNLKLYHFDVYRIDDLGEMYEIGFEEYLYGQGVCIVEWGNLVKELLPNFTIGIDIVRIDDTTREIMIASNNMDLCNPINVDSESIKTNDSTGASASEDKGTGTCTGVNANIDQSTGANIDLGIGAYVNPNENLNLGDIESDKHCPNDGNHTDEVDKKELSE